MIEAKTSISANELRVEVPGRLLVDQLNASFENGEFVAILGQNGAGKSLSLMTLAGLREADGGSIGLDDQALDSIDRQALARRIALLPQDTDDIFPATVMDTVMIGRHPHIARFQWESKEDFEIANNCLKLLDLDGMAERDVLTLSGGERRRLAIAQILTQSPDIYLLDEPTNHLDPQHQLDVLHLFREKANKGACVVATLHDVNLAARFADRALLLYGDGRWESGAVDDVLTEERLSELYATPMDTVPWRDRNLFVAHRQP